MNEEFDPARAAAMRSMIIAHAKDTSAPRRRVLATVGLIAAGAVGGAGISAAAFATTGAFSALVYPAQPSGQPTPSLAPAVPAPAGTLPGAPIISVLGDTEAVEVVASTEISLSVRPEGATHLRVSVTPQTPGTLSWGTDAGGNNPSSGWSEEDIAAGRGTNKYDFPLDDAQDTLYLVPAGGADVLVAMQYVTYVPTQLGINADGDTYGVDGGPSGAPDLIAVIGTDSDGQSINGYVWRAELYADSPTSTTAPTSPAEALEMQDERERDYSQGWEIPLYNSDGNTRIGIYHIG